MGKSKTEEFILRYTGEGSPPDKDVQHIKNACDVEVLDMDERMALVCSTDEAVSGLSQDLPEWIVSGMLRVELPDLRPHVQSKTSPKNRRTKKTPVKKENKGAA
jgi:hypothetical protein